MDSDAYRKALDLKACLIKQLAVRIRQTTDSGVVLDLSIELRHTAREMRELVHDHMVEDRTLKKAGRRAAAPEGE